MKCEWKQPKKNQVGEAATKLKTGAVGAWLKCVL